MSSEVIPVASGNLATPRSCWFWAAVLIIGLLAVIIRAAVAIADPLWTDELHSAWSTHADFSQIALRARLGNQGPLYFWLLWIVRQGFSLFPQLDPVIGLRFVSWLAGILLILLTSRLVWRWTGSSWATVAIIWLLAINTELIFYASEARPYALMQVLGLWQISCFWKWMEELSSHRYDPSNNSVLRLRTVLGLILSTVIMLGMQVTSVWLLLVELIFLVGVFCVREFRQRQALQIGRLAKSGVFIAVAVVTLVCLLPLLPDGQQLWSNRESWSTISDREQLLSQSNLSLRWGLLMPSIALGVAALGSQGVCRSSVSDIPQPNERKLLPNRLVFAALWAIIPLVCLWSVDFLEVAPLANRRYAQIGTVAIPVFAALVIGYLARPWQRIGLTVVVMLSGLIVNPWVLASIKTASVPQMRFEDWGSAITEINRELGDVNNEAGQPVLLMFPNLIEDSQLTPRLNVGNASQIGSAGDQQLHEYLRFVVSAVPSIEKNQVQCWVYPTLTFAGLAAKDLATAKQAPRIWVLIRASDLTTDEILSKIVEQLDGRPRSEEPAHPAKQRWQIDQAQFDSTSWSDVRLFRVRQL